MKRHPFNTGINYDYQSLICELQELMLLDNILTCLQELQWKNQEPYERKTNIIPKKFSCLRLVPAYERFTNERFERCLDLYLCPRQRKMKVVIITYFLLNFTDLQYITFLV